MRGIRTWWYKRLNGINEPSKVKLGWETGSQESGWNIKGTNNSKDLINISYGSLPTSVERF